MKRLLEKKITCFAMERLPRITRAQSMDALSSQSALAGYYAVQLGATHLASHSAEDHDSRRRHRSSQGAGDGARRCGARSARHSASSGRRDRRLRRPAGNPGTGAVAGRDLRRDRRRCPRQRRLRPRTDRRGKDQGRRGADQAHPGGRSHHHHRRHSRPAIAEADQQGAGRRDEGGRRDRRPVRRGRRQLRGHAARRDGGGRPR